MYQILFTDCHEESWQHHSMHESYEKASQLLEELRDSQERCSCGSPETYYKLKNASLKAIRIHNMINSVALK